MEKQNLQKELFGEFSDPRRQPNKFGHLFQKKDFSVSLGAERLVFLSIGVLMLAVVSFALGVERGKAVSRGPARPTAPAIQAPALAAAKAAAPGASSKTPQKTDTKQTVLAKGAESTCQAPVAAAPDRSKPFMIVAGSYSKEAYAAKEIGRLRSIGFEAYMMRNGQYYMACVGSFANKETAQKTLGRIKQLYKDAYVKAR